MDYQHLHTATQEEEKGKEAETSVIYCNYLSQFGSHRGAVLTLTFPLAVFTGWPSFNQVMEGLGMPLAMHCIVTDLYITTARSEVPADLMVGGTARSNRDNNEIAFEHMHLNIYKQYPTGKSSSSSIPSHLPFFNLLTETSIYRRLEHLLDINLKYRQSAASPLPEEPTMHYNIKFLLVFSCLICSHTFIAASIWHLSSRDEKLLSI